MGQLTSGGPFLAVAVVALAILSFLTSGCASTAGVQDNQTGMMLFRNGRYAESEREFRKAVEADPKNAVFVDNLGFACVQQGRVDEAIIYYQKAIALDDKRASFRRDLGDAYRVQGKLEAALKEYEAALARSQVEPVRWAIIDVAFDMGTTDAWMRTFEDSIKDTKPEGSEAISKVFLTEQAILHAFELEGRYDELITRAAKDIEALKGVRKEEGGYVIPIVTPFFVFIRTVPKRQINTDQILGSLYVLRGRGYLEQGLEDAALSDFRMSSEVAPTGWGGAYLGIASLRGNAVKEAVFQLRKALEMRPSWIAGRVYYAVALKMNGDAAQADEELAKATRLAENRVDLTLPSAREFAAAKALASKLWETGRESSSSSDR